MIKIYIMLIHNRYFIYPQTVENFCLLDSFLPPIFVKLPHMSLMPTLKKVHTFGIVVKNELNEIALITYD